MMDMPMFIACVAVTGVMAVTGIAIAIIIVASGNLLGWANKLKRDNEILPKPQRQAERTYGQNYFTRAMGRRPQD